MKSNKLSKQDLEIWHAFKSMGQLVMARIERDIADATGLTGADFGVLSRLVDLGDGELRQKTLADSMKWHKSRLSHQLTRMQDRGFVERLEPEPRVVVVSITKLGREKLLAARPVHAASVRRWLLERLSEKESELLVKIGAALASDRP